jgi:glycosyltransferase involved in cell wall biosynthesis
VLKKTGNPVYKPGNPQALAEAVEEVKGSQKQVGEQNRSYATEKMSWEKVSSSHIEFYISVLG